MIKFNPVIGRCRLQNGFWPLSVRIFWHQSDVLSRRSLAGGGQRPIAEKLN